jgi:hypothetical protein
MNQIGRNFPVRRPSSTICVAIATIGVMPTPPETKTTGRSLAGVRVNLPRGVIASMRNPGFAFAWR